MIVVATRISSIHPYSTSILNGIPCSSPFPVKHATNKNCGNLEIHNLQLANTHTHIHFAFNGENTFRKYLSLKVEWHRQTWHCLQQRFFTHTLFPVWHFDGEKKGKIECKKNRSNYTFQSFQLKRNVCFGCHFFFAFPLLSWANKHRFFSLLPFLFRAISSNVYVCHAIFQKSISFHCYLKMKLLCHSIQFFFCRLAYLLNDEWT